MGVHIFLVQSVSFCFFGLTRSLSRRDTKNRDQVLGGFVFMYGILLLDVEWEFSKLYS